MTSRRASRVVRFAAAIGLAASSSVAAAAPGRDAGAGDPPGTGRAVAHVDGVPVSDAAQPSGTLTVAYPDEPAAWLPAFHQDAASGDLAALWGLPLYAFDDAGQLRPALVMAAEVVGSVDGGWAVDLTLRPGEWTDGTDVTSADVVATLEAVPEASAAASAALAPIAGVTSTGADTVRVVFDEPLGRWAHVLADAGPMLPASVLERDGIEAFRDEVPVTAGPFRLVEAEPGLRRRFEAFSDGPLGPPRLAAVEVVTVPSYETALGLLRDGEVDATIGHLALEPIARVDLRLDGFDVAAPQGGTIVTWRWSPDVDLEVSRTQAHSALRLEAFAQGLLGDFGEVVDDVVVGARTGPVELDQVALVEVEEVVIATPRSHEVTALAGRAARDALERRGATVRVVSDEGDVLHREPLGDAQVLARRLSAWPSLQALFDAFGGREDASVAAGDRADTVGDAVVGEAMSALVNGADELPLVRVAVAHTWATHFEGVRPSAWPGAGFWAAARWQNTLG